MSALDTQVGGSHYKNLGEQPMAFSMRLGLNACQHTAIKYVTRYEDKGTPLKDLNKAIHCIELQQELEALHGGKNSGMTFELAVHEGTKYANANRLSPYQVDVVVNVLLSRYEPAKLSIKRLIAALGPDNEGAEND